MIRKVTGWKILWDSLIQVCIKEYVRLLKNPGGSSRGLCFRIKFQFRSLRKSFIYKDFDPNPLRRGYNCFVHISRFQFYLKPPFLLIMYKYLATVMAPS
jgi:hypothetical protein